MIPFNSLKQLRIAQLYPLNSPLLCQIYYVLLFTIVGQIAKNIETEVTYLPSGYLSLFVIISFQLWTVFNRLCIVNSYPPVISQKEIHFLFEKVAHNIKKTWYVCVICLYQDK